MAVEGLIHPVDQRPAVSLRGRVDRVVEQNRRGSADQDRECALDQGLPSDPLTLCQPLRGVHGFERVAPCSNARCSGCHARSTGCCGGFPGHRELDRRTARIDPEPVSRSEPGEAGEARTGQGPEQEDRPRPAGLRRGAHAKQQPEHARHRAGRRLGARHPAAGAVLVGLARRQHLELLGRRRQAERILLYLSLAFLVICLVFGGRGDHPAAAGGWRPQEPSARIERGPGSGRGGNAVAGDRGPASLEREARPAPSRGHIPLAIAIAAGVGQAVIFAHWANPIDHSICINHDGNAEEPSGDGLPTSEDQQTLAERYAPRVYFYPGEPWGPVTPARFIEGSKLVWNSPRAGMRWSLRRVRSTRSGSVPIAKRTQAAADDAQRL